jgi:hypothetical protein
LAAGDAFNEEKNKVNDKFKLSDVKDKQRERNNLKSVLTKAH